jgi:hypothetical protein
LVPISTALQNFTTKVWDCTTQKGARNASNTPVFLYLRHAMPVKLFSCRPVILIQAKRGDQLWIKTIFYEFFSMNTLSFYRNVQKV